MFSQEKSTVLIFLILLYLIDMRPDLLITIMPRDQVQVGDSHTTQLDLCKQ